MKNQSTTATVFLGGFLTGGVLAASLGAEVISELRTTVSYYQQETRTLRAEVSAVAQEVEKIRLRVQRLALQWQRDLAAARGHMQLHDDGTID